MQLSTHRLKQVARFFLFQIQITVSRHAERCHGHNVVPAIHAGRVIRKYVGEKNKVDACLRGQPHQTRQHSRHRDHAHVGATGATLAFQQQPNAERFVQDARKGMCGINRDRGQQGINFFFAVCINKCFLLRRQVLQVKHAYVFALQRRQQLLVPALILFADKLARLAGNQVTFLLRAQGVGAGVNVAVFNSLQQSGHTNFKKFVQIAGSNRQELYPLQQGIGFIIGFFEHALVEGEPRDFPIDI